MTNKYLASLKEGYKNHQVAYSIILKYDSPCAESAEELKKAGITKEKWNRLKISQDISLEGIIYSIGGIASWIKFGLPGYELPCMSK
jgi:hypothetical protein